MGGNGNGELNISQEPSISMTGYMFERVVNKAVFEFRMPENEPENFESWKEQLCEAAIENTLIALFEIGGYYEIEEMVKKEFEYYHKNKDFNINDRDPLAKSQQTINDLETPEQRMHHLNVIKEFRGTWQVTALSQMLYQHIRPFTDPTQIYRLVPILAANMAYYIGEAFTDNLASAFNIQGTGAIELAYKRDIKTFRELAESLIDDTAPLEIVLLKLDKFVLTSSEGVDLRALHALLKLKSFSESEGMTDIVKGFSYTDLVKINLISLKVLIDELDSISARAKDLSILVNLSKDKLRLRYVVSDQLARNPNVDPNWVDEDELYVEEDESDKVFLKPKAPVEKALEMGINTILLQQLVPTVIVSILSTYNDYEVRVKYLKQLGEWFMDLTDFNKHYATVGRIANDMLGLARFPVFRHLAASPVRSLAWKYMGKEPMYPREFFQYIFQKLGRGKPVGEEEKETFKTYIKRGMASEWGMVIKDFAYESEFNLVQAGVLPGTTVDEAWEIMIKNIKFLSDRYYGSLEEIGKFFRTHNELPEINAALGNFMLWMLELYWKLYDFDKAKPTVIGRKTFKPFRGERNLIVKLPIKEIKES